MSSKSARYAAVLMVGAVCATSAAAKLAAQDDGQNRGQASATVVMVRSLPPGASVVVQRGHGGRARNLILVTEASTAADLASAFSLLRAARERDGEEVDRPLRLIVPSNGLRQALNAEAALRLEEHLGRLRTAPTRPIDGVGTVRSVTVALPNLRDTTNRPSQ